MIIISIKKSFLFYIFFDIITLKYMYCKNIMVKYKIKNTNIKLGK